MASTETHLEMTAFCSPSPHLFTLRNRKTRSESKCKRFIVCEMQPRREFLKIALALPTLPWQAKAALEYPELRGLDETPAGNPFLSREGIKIQEVSEGTGDEAVMTGSIVAVKYVLRRSNGYFIDASYGFDRFDNYTFRAGSGQVIDGFDHAIKGMRVGGRRRFVVPPELGYVKGVKGPGPTPPDFGAKRSLASHCKEPLVFEVQVVKIRN